MFCRAPFLHSIALLRPRLRFPSDPAHRHGALTSRLALVEVEKSEPRRTKYEQEQVWMGSRLCVRRHDAKLVQGSVHFIQLIIVETDQYI